MGGFVVRDGELRGNEVYDAERQNARTGVRNAEPMRKKTAICHEDTKKQQTRPRMQDKGTSELMSAKDFRRMAY